MRGRKMHFSPSYNEERQHSNKKMTSKPIVPNVKVKVAAKRNHSRLIISLASVKKNVQNNIVKKSMNVRKDNHEAKKIVFASNISS